MYPILVDVSQLKILVIGGGQIATRKLAGLLAAGATATVIAPSVTPEIFQWQKTGQVQLYQRAFAAGDTVGFDMLFIATNQPAVNEAAFAERTPGQLVNDTTAKERSNFMNLALVKNEAGTVGITTFGASPATAKAWKEKIRQVLAE